MNIRLLGILLAASMAFACGDDDDGGGGGADGCAHVQEICDGDGTVEIDCDRWDEAPQSVRDCASKADECSDVVTCLAGGS